jgi:hypothetical protein
MSALNSLQQGCDGNAAADSTEGQELRIAGLFAILATSAIGVSLPLLSRGRYPSLLFIARCFGAGIVLATGFAHVSFRSTTHGMWGHAQCQHISSPPMYAAAALGSWHAHQGAHGGRRCCSTRCRTSKTRAWGGTGATRLPWSSPPTVPWAPSLLVCVAALAPPPAELPIVTWIAFG